MPNYYAMTRKYYAFNLFLQLQANKKGIRLNQKHFETIYFFFLKFTYIILTLIYLLRDT